MNPKHFYKVCCTARFNIISTLTPRDYDSGDYDFSGDYDLKPLWQIFPIEDTVNFSVIMIFYTNLFQQLQLENKQNK